MHLDVEPKIGVGPTPQNGWFIIMEDPMNKWMIWGVKTGVGVFCDGNRGF